MWFSKQSKKVRTQPGGLSRRGKRRLLFEGLETRQLLAGLVDVVTGGGFLTLNGDGSNNGVEIRQGANVGQYTIQGTNSTQLTLNGSAETFTSLSINGIISDITVDLDSGDDTFQFLGKTGGGQSSVPANLDILNDHGSNRNTISNVLVNGDLSITKNVAATGYNELHILDSTIIGFTDVDNIGAGSGDSLTEIDNSHLQGNGGPGPAFVLSNGIGNDINEIKGNSQFGTGPFPIAGPVVVISNGDGGSRTTFTGASAVAGFGTTTVYGELDISNGNNVPGTLDIVTFNGSNVLGEVSIDHGVGDTQTHVTNSTLGSHLISGGPVFVRNDAGFDQFAMTDAEAPWGLSINNDAAGANTSLWGSAATITDSRVGTAPFGPALPGFPGVALLFNGDHGRDVFNVSNTILGGTLDLRLYNGNNDVSLFNGSSVVALRLVAGTGNDTVLIDDARIQASVFVRLDAGADRFFVRNVDPFTQWPSPLLGAIDIDGGIGVDTTNLSALALGALGFEVFVA